jgi:CCR4-NOT transcription complex subunit 6
VSEQVARSRKYTPSQDDVGFVLKYECSIFDPNHPYIDLGRPMLGFTSRVRPAPNLPLRNLVGLPLPYSVTKAGPSSRFTVLSYNLLADLYAKVSSSACLGDGAARAWQHVLLIAHSPFCWRWP